MKQNNSSVKAGVMCLLDKIGDGLIWTIAKIMRSQLWVDRKIVKRYLNMETPIYKMWWQGHTIAIQKKLDSQHK